MEDPGRIWRERGLKEAVLAGDESAWRWWYDESADALYAYVAWRCGGLRDVAEEVVQDVWLTAVRRLPAFDPNMGTFLGWLRGIAAGILRNRFRRDRHRTCVGQVRPPAEAADAEVSRREQAVRIATVLSGLPESYEAVLRAKYLEAMAVAAIALDRGISEKAVESLLSRAREAFRGAYQPDE